jgi:DNA-binding NtrC family response regulator
MPVLDGHQFLKHVRKSYPSIPVIILTSSNDSHIIIKLMRDGAVDYITKPYERERLKVTIQNVLSMQNMAGEIEELKRSNSNGFHFSDMIGHDGCLTALIHKARKAAMTDLPILITGETGTGKDLLAKAIHGESNYKDGPFVAVNCGAIPPTLIESTLFGHEKGAFTGATDRAIGKFREANNGTIFLDEIGELPMEAQVRLLRVLQEQEVEPVGAPRPVKINVRVIAATHRNLIKDVRDYRFREDLYYRLNILDIHIPPLRERNKDIKELCDYFLNEIADKTNQATKTIDTQAMNILHAHHWPGNIRELKNRINRAAILSDSTVINHEDLFPKEPRGHENDNKDNNVISAASQKFITLHEMERSLMRDALTANENNITKAAASIGMAKSTFYRKMKTHNIVRI